MPPQIALNLTSLRRYAIARSLFAPTTLPQALARLGFVQADPIRAPARAQDVVLRHRVKGYKVGDLERRYARLDVEEDFFVNYGFVTPRLQALLHPRPRHPKWTDEQHAMATAIAQFVAQRGTVHPKQVDDYFGHGNTTNWFGGNSKISTQMLDDLHYRGQLRVARRDKGTRVYAAPKVQHADGWPAPPSEDGALDALADAIVDLYAPLPAPSLRQLMGLLKNGVPQWANRMPAAYERALQRLPSATVDGVTWLWPLAENPLDARWHRRKPTDGAVRLLAPFDPVVWDRRRFALFWQWTYTFEAYTPPAKRLRGYYALPLLWNDEVMGWANLSQSQGRLQAQLGYVAGSAPAGRNFNAALDREVAAMEEFLKLGVE